MHTLDDLIYLMARLRNPETGCPWDLKQDFASIVPHTLEEAYEVADAIERADWPHLEEELGDLMFQVIFYARLGEEQSSFTLASVIDKLVRKLIRRHPHVFPGQNLNAERAPDAVQDDAQIAATWNAIKAEEKRLAEAAGHVPPTDWLGDVPVTLPGLSRAVKLQKKASRVGFDWADARLVLDKIEEELQEVRVELASGDQQRLEAEIGDLLFAVTNLARLKSIDPEVAVRGTNQRFRSRFAHVERVVNEYYGGFDNATLAQMEQAWQEAKRLEKQGLLPHLS